MTLWCDIKLKKSALIVQIHLDTLKFSSIEVICYIQDLQDFIFRNWGPSSFLCRCGPMINLWCEMKLSEYLGTGIAEDLGWRRAAGRCTDTQAESKHQKISLTWMDTHDTGRDVKFNIPATTILLRRNKEAGQLWLTWGGLWSLLAWAYLLTLLPCRSCRICRLLWVAEIFLVP